MSISTSLPVSVKQRKNTFSLYIVSRIILKAIISKRKDTVRIERCM